MAAVTAQKEQQQPQQSPTALPPGPSATAAEAPKPAAAAGPAPANQEQVQQQQQQKGANARTPPLTGVKRGASEQASEEEQYVGRAVSKEFDGRPFSGALWGGAWPTPAQGAGREQCALASALL